MTAITSEHLRQRSERAYALARVDEVEGRDLLALARVVVANELLSLANEADASEVTDAPNV